MYKETEKKIGKPVLKERFSEGDYENEQKMDEKGILYRSCSGNVYERIYCLW